MLSFSSAFATCPKMPPSDAALKILEAVSSMRNREDLDFLQARIPSAIENARYIARCDTLLPDDSTFSLPARAVLENSDHNLSEPATVLVACRIAAGRSPLLRARDVTELLPENRKPKNISTTMKRLESSGYLDRVEQDGNMHHIYRLTLEG